MHGGDQDRVSAVWRWLSASEWPYAVLSGVRSELKHAPRISYTSHIKLYNGGMATMNMSAARENLPAAVELSRIEAVILERYGHPAAVLVSPERYEELMAALEDAEDVAAFDAAMSEEGPNIPWEQVKADLGWA